MLTPARQGSLSDMLPDILGPGLRILFCGTAAGTVSARRGHYYAGPGNRFWPMLAETGLTPRLLRPEEDRLMPGFGLGLTDLAKTAAGMDHQIPAAAYAPERLAEVIRDWQPRIVAFTSLTAARKALAQKTIGAGRLPPDPDRDLRFPGVVFYALPSPSGAARATFDPAPWQALADDVKGR